MAIEPGQAYTRVGDGGYFFPELGDVDVAARVSNDAFCNDVESRGLPSCVTQWFYDSGDVLPGEDGGTRFVAKVALHGLIEPPAQSIDRRYSISRTQIVLGNLEERGESVRQYPIDVLQDADGLLSRQVFFALGDVPRILEAIVDVNSGNLKPAIVWPIQIKDDRGSLDATAAKDGQRSPDLREALVTWREENEEGPKWADDRLETGDFVYIIDHTRPERSDCFGVEGYVESSAAWDTSIVCVECGKGGLFVQDRPREASATQGDLNG